MMIVVEFAKELGDARSIVLGLSIVLFVVFLPKGIAGGVGGLLIQLLKHLGAEVIATASRESSIDWCRQIGLGQYFWQHDWGSRGQIHPRANIHQVAKWQTTIDGVVCDINDVYTLDFGQWWPVDPITLATGSLA